jgi:hypothetical protein
MLTCGARLVSHSLVESQARWSGVAAMMIVSKTPTCPNNASDMSAKNMECTACGELKLQVVLVSPSTDLPCNSETLHLA